MVVQYDKGMTNQHFITDHVKKTAELKDAAVLTY